MEPVIGVLLFVSGNLFSLAIITVTAYAAGRLLTRGRVGGGVIEETSIAVALGLGVVASLLFLLGLVDLLTRPLVLGLIAGFLGGSLWAAVRSQTLPRIQLAAICSGPSKPLILGLVIGAPLLVMALYPPTDFDATMYHLPYADAFVAAHGLEFLPSLRFPVFPQLQEMLFVLGFFLSGEIAAQLTQHLALLLTASMLYCWGVAQHSRRVGLWAAALWLGNPLAVWLGGCAYVDIGLTLMVTGALLTWEKWRAEGSGSDRWLALAAGFVGFAAATKYLGLFFVGAGTVATAVTAFSQVSSQRFLSAARAVVLFVVVAGAVCAPSYARIVYHTGNPVFPYYPAFFGASEWADPKDLATDGTTSSAVGFVCDKVIGVISNLDDLILVPFNAVFNRQVFNWQAPLSPFYLVLIPLLAPLALGNRGARRILILCAAYGLFWLTTFRDVRFLLPVLPALGLALAVGAERLATTRWAASRYRAEVLIALILLAPGWAYGVYKTIRLGPPPVNAAAREQYLARHVVGYPAIALLNRTHGSDYTVYTLFGENLAYFAEGRFLGDRFGPARFAEIRRSLRYPRRLHKKLSDLGVDHLLILDSGRAVSLTRTANFRRHFSELESQPGYILFALAARLSENHSLRR